MKMKKLEKKISKLEEQKLKKPSSRLDKKIIKLEKKKVKLEKWLKIKLPLRILIKGVATWLIIGGVCYGCSYIPVVREVKMATMAAIAYATPEPVTKVLDVVTLNVGVNKDDFEWLKTRLQNYINGEIELNVKQDESESNYIYIYDEDSDACYIDYNSENQPSDEEYINDKNKEIDELTEKALGTSINNVNSMSIPEILMRVSINSTPELISKILDTTNLTTESKQILEKDINKALKIIPKLNNTEINELIELITNMFNNNEIINQANTQKENTQMLMELEQEQLKALQNGENDRVHQIQEQIDQIQQELNELQNQ